MEIAFMIVLFIGLAILAIALIIKNARRSRTTRKSKKIQKPTTPAINKTAEINSLLDLYKSNPNDLMILHKLSFLEAKYGNAQAGIAHATKLLEKNLSGSGIQHVKAILVLAIGYKRTQNPEQMEKFLTMARGIDPTDTEVNTEFSIFEYNRGNFNEAFSYAGKALRINGSNFEAHLYRGLASFQLSNLDTATTHLQQALSLKPGTFLALTTLARTFAKKNDDKQASLYFRKAIEKATTKQEQIETLLHWGQFARFKMDHKLAVSLLEQAIKAEPNAADKKTILISLVAIFEEQKDIPKVIWGLQGIARLEPGNTQIREKLNYYAELNSNDKLQKFEMLGLAPFTNFCKSLARTIIDIDEIQNTTVNPDGSIDILANKTSKTKHTIYQFRFLRTTGEVGEMILKDLYSKMRTNGGEKAILTCNSTFTKGAIAFSETRVVSLIDKKALLTYLAKVK